MHTALTEYQAKYVLFAERTGRAVLALIQDWDTIVDDRLYDRAWHTLSCVLELVETHRAIWWLALELLLALAPKMERAGRREQWMSLLRHGIRHSQNLADRRAEADLSLHLAFLYQLCGRLNEARDTVEVSVRYYEESEDVAQRARSLGRKAYIARLQRDHAHAAEIAERVLDLAGDDQAATRAQAYLVLGTVAYDNAEWDEAIRWFRLALTHAERAEDARMVAWNLVNLGTAYKAMKRYDEALDVYGRALEIFDIVADPVHRAVVINNLGNIWMELGDSGRALEECFLPAKRTFQRAVDEIRLAMVLVNIGMAQRGLGRWRQAHEAFRYSQQRWEAIGNVAETVNVMYEIGVTFDEQGLTREARNMLASALLRLEEMAGKPGYMHLHDSVTAKVREIEQRDSG